MIDIDRVRSARRKLGTSSKVNSRLALFDDCPTGSIEIFYARVVGQPSNKAKRLPTFKTESKI